VPGCRPRRPFPFPGCVNCVGAGQHRPLPDAAARWPSGPPWCWAVPALAGSWSAAPRQGRLISETGAAGDLLCGCPGRLLAAHPAWPGRQMKMIAPPLSQRGTLRRASRPGRPGFGGSAYRHCRQLVEASRLVLPRPWLLLGRVCRLPLASGTSLRARIITNSLWPSKPWATRPAASCRWVLPLLRLAGHRRRAGSGWPPAQ